MNRKRREERSRGEGGLAFSGPLVRAGRTRTLARSLELELEN
jgi:hypothetical protein